MSELNPLTPEAQAKIDAMTHMDLCHKWRFSSSEEGFFQGEAGQYAHDRLWKHFKGFTPAISKALGWGNGDAA